MSLDRTPLPLDLAGPVRRALAEGAPVLALESTLLAHGMPWPANLETALGVEQIIRELGVTPATVALLDGRLRVGLAPGELERIARLGTEAVKCSRRDIAAVLKRGGAGATTVAATMIVAHRAGIRVFATGGIGGVHRDAADTFDVSADLAELSRTPVAVVCSGPKAILDLPRTRECLETLGVPVIGYGTDELPAFYARTSGLPVDHRADQPGSVAEILRLHWSLGLGGAIIANPVPREHALDPAAVEAAVSAAWSEARSRGVTGKAVTPALLAAVERLTAGRSLDANIALVRDNARLGAAIAAALTDQRSDA